MRQQSHPNVLPLLCSFVHERNLWMVMPYVSGGSVLNIMKYAYPEVCFSALSCFPASSRQVLCCMLSSWHLQATQSLRKTGLMQSS